MRIGGTAVCRIEELDKKVGTFAFVNLLSPIYAFVTAMMGRNIFWADGSYTNILGKTKPGKPADCPDEVRAIALANLEAARAAGKAPRPSE